jgi:hypothetical protein
MGQAAYRSERKQVGIALARTHEDEANRLAHQVGGPEGDQLHFVAEDVTHATR